MNENFQNNQEIKSTKISQFEIDETTGRLTQSSASRYFSWYGWFAFTLTMAVLLVSLAADVVFTIFLPEVREHFAFGNVITFVSIYAIALPMSMPFILKLPYEKPIKAKMSFGHFLIGLCICMALMTVGSTISDTFFSLIQSLIGSSSSNPVAENVSSVPWWFNLLTTVILAPVLEEIVFRRIICDRLSALGEGFAIFLSAALFGLYHGNFYQLFYAFLIGAFLAFIYLKTGKLWYTILYHMIVNFLGGFVAPLIVEHLDLEALSSIGSTESIESIMPAIFDNLIPLALFGIYELLVLAMTVLGIVMLIIKRREFKVQPGLLQPPKKWVGTFLLSSGIAAAIGALSINLIWSIIF